jgi:hypothetical protein
MRLLWFCFREHPLPLSMMELKTMVETRGPHGYLQFVLTLAKLIAEDEDPFEDIALAFTIMPPKDVRANSQLSNHTLPTFRYGPRST